MQKYYIKATLSGGRSGYDPKFVYKEGWNEHPNPDLSDKVCSEGIHLTRTIRDANSYVDKAIEYYLAIPDKILGQDDTKVRTNKCYLWRIPQEIVNNYKSKCEALYDDYWSKALCDDYCSKRKALEKQTMKRIIKLYKAMNIPA